MRLTSKYGFSCWREKKTPLKKLLICLNSHCYQPLCGKFLLWKVYLDKCNGVLQGSWINMDVFQKPWDTSCTIQNNIVIEDILLDVWQSGDATTAAGAVQRRAVVALLRGSADAGDILLKFGHRSVLQVQKHGVTKPRILLRNNAGECQNHGEVGLAYLSGTVIS